MGFLDRLRRWLSARPETGTNHPEAEASTARVIDSTSIDSSTPMDSVNSIAFSTDLSTLYLIDDGRAIAFPLDSRGVQLALVNGQVSVVTTAKEVEVHAPRPEIPAPEPELELEGTERSRVSLLKRPEGREVRLKLDPRDQFTATFNPDSGVLAIIGSTDIISTLTQPDGEQGPQAECRQFLFDLNREIVLVRKTGQLLSIQTQKRK